MKTEEQMVNGYKIAEELAVSLIEHTNKFLDKNHDRIEKNKMGTTQLMVWAYIKIMQATYISHTESNKTGKFHVSEILDVTSEMLYRMTSERLKFPIWITVFRYANVLNVLLGSIVIGQLFGIYGYKVLGISIMLIGVVYYIGSERMRRV